MGIPRIRWQGGQLVVSKTWQCNYKVSTPESYTVYAIVENVKQTKDYFVELVTREAGYVGPIGMVVLFSSVKRHFEPIKIHT